MTALFAWCVSLGQFGSFSFGIGSIIAAILSWKRNQDILWAVLAFIFGWLYIIYWLFTRD